MPLPAHHYAVPQVGVAGYNKSVGPPIYEAFFYDLDAPGNDTRFSYFANSSHARMYHATTGLMLGGTVLSVGCDDLAWCNDSTKAVDVAVPPFISPTLSITSIAVRRLHAVHRVYGGVQGWWM